MVGDKERALTSEGTLFDGTVKVSGILNEDGRDHVSFQKEWKFD